MTKYKDGEFCPRIQKKCMERACKFWVHVRGINPNTGLEVDEWNCADVWKPFLMIENSKVQRETGAAVESFRNEMVRMNDNPQLPWDRQELLDQQQKGG